MKEINKAFKKEVQKAMTGIYVRVLSSEEDFVPIFPVKTLTAETFGIIDGDVLLTAEDFHWYRDNGSDRDFKFDTANECEEYYSSDDMPYEIVSFLNGYIGVKFAKKTLENTKTVLALAGNKEAEKEITEDIHAFEKVSDCIEKLEVAYSALDKALDALKEAEEETEVSDKENRKEVEDALKVIGEIIKEIK